VDISPQTDRGLYITVQ